MKIVVFGATGLVGKHVVSQAINQGHNVVAFGRSVHTADFPENKNLVLVAGALFDEAQVSQAVSGCDAVVSAIGGAPDGIDKSRSLGLKNVVEAMQKTGVDRIVAVGGMGVLNIADGGLVMDQKDFPHEYQPVSQEHLSALKTLEHSGLKWTFVCPPMIKNADPVGGVHVKANEVPSICNNYVNAGDLSLFMLDELSKNEFVFEKVGICN